MKVAINYLVIEFACFARLSTRNMNIIMTVYTFIRTLKQAWHYCALFLPMALFQMIVVWGGCNILLAFVTQDTTRPYMRNV